MSWEPEHNEMTRRDFLATAAKGAGAMAMVVFGGGFAFVSANTVTGEGAGTLGPMKYDPTRHRYLYLIDVSKCIGCGSCVRACERENDVPKNFFRTWVERYHVSRTGQVFADSPNGAHDGFRPREIDADITKSFFVPKLCNHCDNTPCVQLCPVGASFVSPDGLVLVDEKRCIGCSYCVQACPYGSRFIHPETHTASKCTLCCHRLVRGEATVCVQSCPTGARRLGDAKELGNEVAEIIATANIRVLKPELHTEPKCFYVNCSQEVR